jgi:phosphoribosylanthranilate isomerase
MDNMRPVVRVKICGITRMEDARKAVDLGAHALGFVFHPPSPRYIAPGRAGAIIRELPPFIWAVGVFVNVSRSIVEDTVARSGIGVIQFHGNETVEECRSYHKPIIKAFRFKGHESLRSAPDYPVSGILVDTGVSGQWGGTGVPLDWDLLKDHLDEKTSNLRQKLILAGGLDASNVAGAIRTISPFAVDVSSGVEQEPGIKDHQKLKEFLHAVRDQENA